MKKRGEISFKKQIVESMRKQTQLSHIERASKTEVQQLLGSPNKY
jgi:hypothetical protein